MPGRGREAASSPWQTRAPTKKASQCSGIQNRWTKPVARTITRGTTTSGSDAPARQDASPAHLGRTPGCTSPGRAPAGTIQSSGIAARSVVT